MPLGCMQCSWPLMEPVLATLPWGSDAAKLGDVELRLWRHQDVDVVMSLRRYAKTTGVCAPSFHNLDATR